MKSSSTLLSKLLLRNSSTRTTTALSSSITRSFSSSFSSQYAPRVLITGSNGQIGVELSAAIRARFGKNSVVTSDVSLPSIESLQRGEPFVFLDVNNKARLEQIVKKEGITHIIHNAAFLSAAAERNPVPALELNTVGLHNVLDVSKNNNCSVFIPSSIAAFGPTTPLDLTPDVTIQRPTTIYGIGKVYAEHMGEYYAYKHGVDFRSLRYPGIISYLSEPGGGTTDWAVFMFYYALKGESYECFVSENTPLPMMYMSDCIRATIKYIFDLTNEDLKKANQRTFNITSFSLTPGMLTRAIQKYIPSFQVTYKPDFRQQIADSWPKAFEDSNARNKWGWKEEYDLDKMTRDMIIHLREKIGCKVEVRGL
nr:unnamed protein product [Naegleria fowleri]